MIWGRSKRAWPLSQKQNEIDFNEYEHFLKANWHRSEIDLNECEHFLEANWDRSEIELNECEHFFKANWERSELATKIQPFLSSCLKQAKGKLDYLIYLPLSIFYLPLLDRLLQLFLLHAVVAGLLWLVVTCFLG